jgi:hypothetical protein
MDIMREIVMAGRSKIMRIIGIPLFFTLMAILVFGSGVTFAQSGGFAPGFIVKNNGDTLRGAIIDRSTPPYEKKYKKIRSKGSGIVSGRYSARKIEKYCIGGDCYQSLWMYSQQKFVKETHISQHGKGDKVFMKVVVDGYLSLLYYEFNDAESHKIDYIPFFKRKDEAELIRVTQGIFGLKKQLLSRYFADCPDLVVKIEKGEIKSPGEIAEYYNSIVGNQRQKSIH